MKKRTLLISFLLMLYIVPLILVPSSYHTAIPTEPNISKDFSSSEYGEESSYSITSFSETLEDDVLFYPDETTVTDLADNGVVVGTESGTFESTFLKDGNTWHGLTTEDYYLEFEVVGTGIPISYALYFTSVSDTPVLQAYNFTLSGFVTVDTISQNSWSNGSLNSLDYVNSTGYVLLQVANSQAENAFLDYAELTHPGMTLADSEHYAESFSDVSDWNDHSNFAEVNDTISSDGDILVKSNHYGGGTDYDYIYCDDMSIDCSSGTWYYEFRTKCTGLDTALIYLRDADGEGSGNIQYISTNEDSDWTTYKGLVTLTSVEQITITAADDDSDSIQYFDYLRISPSDECGWQHDGSTTEGISSSDGGTVSSDGEQVTLTSDTDGSTFLIPIDITATASALSCTYYPFLALNVTSISEGDGFILEQYDGSAWATISDDDGYGWDVSTGLDRYSMRSQDTYVYQFRITLTQTATIKFSFLKAYSIANWTVTQASTMPISHYLYANDGALHRAGSSISGYYFTLIFDPTLAVDTSTYNIWNLTVSDRGTSYTYDFAFKSKINDTWGSYSFDITRGESASGTLSSVQFIIYDSMTISAIKFIDNHNWHLIDEVTVIFYVELNMTGFNIFMVFIGLAMLPASTMYLVYGGKEALSRRKVFIVLIAFGFGCGILLGGLF